MHAPRLRTRKTALALAATVVLGALAPQDSQAAACTFNPASGNWNQAANWNCGIVPSGPAVDSAAIGAGKTVTVSDARSIHTLDQAGTLNIGGAIFTLQGGGSTGNSGRIVVGSSGAAVLQAGHNINNGGGVIQINDGSVLNLAGSTLSGGTVQTDGSGAVVASSHGSNALRDTTLNGRLDLSGSNAWTTISGLTLNGSADVGASGRLALDGRGGANTLGGTGTINLGATGSRLYVEGNNAVTLGADVTVRGAGAIGQAIAQSGGGSMTLVNNGRIVADLAGQQLTIVPIANSGFVTNNNLLEARNGGTLGLLSSVTQGSSGRVSAQTGSIVLIDGARITGGQLLSTGTGAIRVSSSGNNVLSGTTLAGAMDMSTMANSRLTVVDGLVNNGTVTIGGSGRLQFSSTGPAAASQTLGGSGSVQMDGGQIHFENTGQTTFGATTTVRGSGTIGQAVTTSGQHVLVNNGLISADADGQTLQIIPIANGSQAVQNNGVLEARNGGRLLLSTHVNSSAGAEMRAGAGSRIEQNGARITGTINTTGSGLFAANSSGSNLLANVTLNGTLDMASIANARETVVNGLVLNGAINGGATSALSFSSRAGYDASQTVSGTGSINLAGGPVYFEGGGQTTWASGITVRGHGNIGQAVLETGPHLLVNNGRIQADVAGQTLQIVPIANGSRAVQNNGVLAASGGGELRLSTDVHGGSASQLQVDGGSRIVQNGVTLTGRINQTGSGALTVTGSGSNLLDGVHFSGTMDLASVASASQRIRNGLTLDGRIDVGGSGRSLSFDNRAAGGAHQVVSGSGTIAVAGGTIRFEGAGSTTLGSDVTLRGHGNVGQPALAAGAHALVNNGTLIAEGGTLNIGQIAGGTLGLSGSGTVRVEGGQLVLATGTHNSQGRLQMGSSGTLALGTQNLTLTSDYTSAQWGSGNGFDRRAGISGSGQVLAGGDAAQRISGAAITGGDTSVATLTLGNMHVGTNSYSYTIANGGSSGPVLRGAIQTAVNGANLSDARLSGSGVTAGNYNAGGPGGSGATQAVVFTADSAGALAPLTGQVLNLRSNFDNIADQKLNIVLGSGAAAYNLAAGQAPATVTVANQRVGGSNSAALAISNTAAAGSYSEDLNARVVASSGPVSGSGSVSGVRAGQGAAGMTVGVDTTTAGFKSGSVDVGYTSTGSVAGVSNGLGTTELGTQAVAVSGNVYQAASGQLVGNTLNFGTLQVGQQVSHNLVVRNTATGAAGFVEDLNVSFGAAGNSQISGSGTLSGILAGSNSGSANGTMTVTVSGSTAGALNSGIAVNYTSAGAVAGVSNGLGLLAVGSEQFGVNGNIAAVANVINQASPQFGSTHINLGAARVGAAAPNTTVALANQATAAPQAALNASISSNGGPFTASGSATLLAPGAGTNALQVGLNTAVAGNYTGANAGSATVALVSDASNVGGCAPNCQMTLAPQTITLEGKVYTAAIGQAGTPAINFGIVRVGDTPGARNITIHNSAAASALNDTLHASVSGLGGVFTPDAAVAGIAAQGSGSLGITLNTTTAGVYSQTGSVHFLSQNADMADVSAGPDATVQVSAQVNNLANADFDLLSGAGLLSHDGAGHFTLDLGRIALGSSGLWTLQLDNDIGGPADLLRGLFDLGAADDFAFSGWDGFDDLAAGQAFGGLEIGFDAERLGSFDDTVVFNGFSFNASDPEGLAQVRSLRIVASVFDPGAGGSVPEPGTLLLMATALLATLRIRAQRARPAQRTPAGAQA